MAQHKPLLGTVKYVKYTEYFGLLLQSKTNNEGFYLEGISDIEYAGDADTCISVHGLLIYFCGTPITW
jgi:hypothetical protein